MMCHYSWCVSFHGGALKSRHGLGCSRRKPITLCTIIWRTTILPNILVNRHELHPLCRNPLYWCFLMEMQILLLGIRTSRRENLECGEHDSSIFCGVGWRRSEYWWIIGCHCYARLKTYRCKESSMGSGV